MNTSSRINWLASALLLVSLCMLCACPTNQNVRAGEDAAARGDWIAAVVSYRRALQADPDDGEIQTRLSAAEFQLTQQTVASVDELVGDDDLEGALHSLLPALELLPQSPELNESHEQIRLHGLDLYMDAHDDEDWRTAFEGATFLLGYYSSAPDVQAFEALTRADYAGQVERRAEEAEGSPGAGLAHWTAVWILIGDDEARERAETLRAELTEELAFAYHVVYEGYLAGTTPPRFGDALAVSTDDPDASMVRVSANLEPAEFAQTVESEQRFHNFLAGYREVPNPAYQDQLRRVSSAEDDMVRAQRSVLDREEAAHDAEVERDRHLNQTDYQTYYNRWDDAVNRLNSARQDLQGEREDLVQQQQALRTTPQTVTEEIWANAPYTVQTYTLSASSAFHFNLRSDGSADRQYHDTYLASTSDETWEAQSSIQLAGNALAYPNTEGELVEGLQLRALNYVSQQLGEMFVEYRDQYREPAWSTRARDTASAVEQLVRYVLLEPGNVPGEITDWLDETLDPFRPGYLLLLSERRR